MTDRTENLIMGIASLIAAAVIAAVAVRGIAVLDGHRTWVFVPLAGIPFTAALYASVWSLRGGASRK